MAEAEATLVDAPTVELTVTLTLDEATQLHAALGDQLYELWSAGITEPIYVALDHALAKSGR